MTTRQLKIEFPKSSFDEEAYHMLMRELDWDEVRIYRKKRKNKMYFNVKSQIYTHSSLNGLMKTINKYFPKACITSGSFGSGLDITVASE
jgi:hypothetical protein